VRPRLLVMLKEAGYFGAWLIRCLAIAIMAGSAAAQSGTTPVVELDLAGSLVQVEYVADPDSRREGLMGRTALAVGTGMLFDFPEGTRPAIWMRNMLISLDLVYIDQNGRIAQIFRRVPPCRTLPCEIYHAAQPVRFVLEVPAGTADTLSLAVGQVLALDAFARVSAPRE
jgi:uncharacterized membrane protein (UPF0127 family)